MTWRVASPRAMWSLSRGQNRRTCTSKSLRCTNRIEIEAHLAFDQTHFRRRRSSAPPHVRIQHSAYSCFGLCSIPQFPCHLWRAYTVNPENELRLLLKTLERHPGTSSSKQIAATLGSAADMSEPVRLSRLRILDADSHRALMAVLRWVSDSTTPGFSILRSHYRHHISTALKRNGIQELL